MAVWSIKIVPGAKPNDLATFVPQLQQPAPDGTYPNGLYADPGDAVSWDNTEGRKAHHPCPTDENYNPLPVTPQNQLSRRIPKGESSRPAYVVVQPTTGDKKTIYYRCSLHPQEHGKITVTVTP
jgi:plastocyanin